MSFMSIFETPGSLKGATRMGTFELEIHDFHREFYLADGGDGNLALVISWEVFNIYNLTPNPWCPGKLMVSRRHLPSRFDVEVIWVTTSPAQS